MAPITLILILKICWRAIHQKYKILRAPGMTILHFHPRTRASAANNLWFYFNILHFWLNDFLTFIDNLIHQFSNLFFIIKCKSKYNSRTACVVIIFQLMFGNKYLFLSNSFPHGKFQWIWSSFFLFSFSKISKWLSCFVQFWCTSLILNVKFKWILPSFFCFHLIQNSKRIFSCCRVLIKIDPAKIACERFKSSNIGFLTSNEFCRFRMIWFKRHLR